MAARSDQTLSSGAAVSGAEPCVLPQGAGPLDTELLCASLQDTRARPSSPFFPLEPLNLRTPKRRRARCACRGRPPWVRGRSAHAACPPRTSWSSSRSCSLSCCGDGTWWRSQQARRTQLSHDVFVKSESLTDRWVQRKRNTTQHNERTRCAAACRQSSHPQVLRPTLRVGDTVIRLGEAVAWANAAKNGWRAVCVAPCR